MKIHRIHIQGILLTAVFMVFGLSAWAQLDANDGSYDGNGSEDDLNDYDIAIPSSFDTLLCLAEVSEGDSIYIPFVNQGAVTITSFSYSYLLNGQSEGPFHWTGSVEQNFGGELVIPPFTNASPGQIVFTLYTENPNGQQDQNTSNDTAVVTITVGEVPQLPFTAVQTDICENDSLTLGNNLPSNYSYYWTEFSDSSRLQIANNSGTYSVDAISADGCITPAVYYVNHFPAPDRQLTPVDSFCMNESPEISVSSKFLSYSWSGPGSVVNDSVFLPEASGNVTLSVTDTNNCNFTFDTSIHVGESPQITYPGAVEFCEGNFALIQPAISDGGETLEFLWSDGNPSQNRNLGTPGRYTVSVTNLSGCKKIDTIDVQRNPLPQTNIVGPSSFCSGSSIAVATDKIFSKYRWNTGNRNRTQQITEGGIYSITITDDKGCVNSTEFNIEEITPKFDLGGDTVLCSGDVLIIDLEGRGDVFRWNDGSNQAKRFITDEGSYVVNVQDSICTFLDSLVVKSIEQPQVDFQYEVNNLEVTFTNLSVQADSFLWYFEPGEYSNAIDPIYEFGDIGEYNVVLEGFNICGAKTVNKEIAVGSISVLDHSRIKNLNLFPNPVNAGGTLNLDLEGISGNNINFRIYNSLGQMMLQEVVSPKNDGLQIQINVSGLSAGTYFLQVADARDKSLIETKQFVIVN